MPVTDMALGGPVLGPMVCVGYPGIYPVMDKHVQGQARYRIDTAATGT